MPVFKNSTSIMITKLTFIFEGYPRAFGDPFWTSGTNQGCNMGFYWCSNNKSFVKAETNWEAGHPIAGESCVYVNFSNEAPNKTYLGTSKCDLENYFVCEVQYHCIYLYFNICILCHSRHM
jgi:hypothetical protein